MAGRGLPGPLSPRIAFLIANAFGGGGTIRTTLNTAAVLARRHEVEIVSVLRHREIPRLPVDPQVRLRVLVDSTGPGSLAGRLLTRIPSRLAHPQDSRYQVFSARTDLALLRYLRSARGVW